MLDAFIRTFSLVKRGDPGLVCDDEGLALGPVVLAKAGFDRAGQRHCELRPTEDVAEALRLAYGPISDRAIERWSRGLPKVAELLTRGEHARAGIFAIMLGFPEIAPDDMVKLAAPAHAKNTIPIGKPNPACRREVQAAASGRAVTAASKSPRAATCPAKDVRAVAATEQRACIRLKEKSCALIAPLRR